MLAGRFDKRVARLEAPLDVALAGGLDTRAVDFRTLDFRLDRFEITVSPPHPQVLCKKLASSRTSIQRLRWDRVRQSQGGAGLVRGFRYSVGMLQGFRFIRLGWIATAALLCAGTAQGAGADSSYAEARKAFVEAYARVTANSPDESAADSEMLKSYPLYPYLKAARIHLALNGSSDSLVRVDQLAADFIAAHEQAPVSRALRSAWLDSLAKREKWGLFIEAYRDAGAADAVRCQSFTARIELGKTDGLAGDIAREWLTPRSLPECTRPFVWLNANGLLTPELIEKRVRLALESNNVAFARQIIEQLPTDRAGPYLQWASLLEHPQRSLDALIASPDLAVDPAALMAGWTRLARTNPSAARERYQGLMSARGLTRETGSPYALALALPLAWNHDPAALEYFDLVASRDFDDPALEWRARAAILAGEWKLASKSIIAMSGTNRRTARWRYWAARAAAQLHDSAQARPLYESLLSDDNYYSGMAAARLHRAVIPQLKTVPVDEELLGSIERVPAMERARELFLCGMRQEALAEWQLGYGSLSEAGRLQSIRLAAGWLWYDQAIAVASAQKVFNDYALLYPRPFDPQVEQAAHQAQLAPELIYGVLRQESLYRADAVSSADARGLMQLQLDTARLTARRWKQPKPELSDLFDPATSTLLGAARLRTLLDQFDGQTSVAVAAYNAGPNAVLRWLPSKSMDSDVWIENIPYAETRVYVQRVLWHLLTFTWLHTKEPQQTKSWLTPIRAMQRMDSDQGLNRG
jgi:soluble lytic murein transglycosylase